MTAGQVLSNALIKEDLGVILFLQIWLDPVTKPGYHWSFFSLGPRRSANFHESWSGRRRDIRWPGHQGKLCCAWDGLEMLAHVLHLPWQSVGRGSQEWLEQGALQGIAPGYLPLQPCWKGIIKTGRIIGELRFPEWLHPVPEEGYGLLVLFS